MAITKYRRLRNWDPFVGLLDLPDVFSDRMLDLSRLFDRDRVRELPAAWTQRKDETMEKRYLLTPGPTPVPPEVLSALGEPVVHHRAPRFTEILKEVLAGLKYVFQTENDVIVFASSGTGAMESAVVNLVEPGDKVIVASCGNFGERWIKLNRTWGAEVVALEYEWGARVEPRDIVEHVRQRYNLVVRTVGNEERGTYGVRVSTHLYINHSEVDMLLKGIREVAARRG